MQFSMTEGRKWDKNPNFDSSWAVELPAVESAEVG